MLATEVLSPYRVIDRCDERGAFAGALLAMLGAAVGPFTSRFVAWMAEEGACDPALADIGWSSFDAAAEL